jgi:hypothetical protein
VNFLLPAVVCAVMILNELNKLQYKN